MDQPYAELASISAIVAITIPTVQVIKALVIDVPCLRKVWTWVWVFATSMTLTLIARYGLHTIEGDIGPDFGCFAVEGHYAAAPEDIVDFLRLDVPVGFGGLARLEGGLGEALRDERGVGRRENLADCGAVLGDKFFH